MKNRYVENLICKVIEKSVSKDWIYAVKEWEIVDCEEDLSLSESCVCGKERLRFLYTIRNINNGEFLYPIGSSCIEKFGRKDLDEQIKDKESMFNLFHAVESNSFIELDSRYFSRRVLRFLYLEGALNTNYNQYNGLADYEFMLEMFNKKNKDNITTKQQRKINAIIINAIIPYLKENLKIR